ncbi:MAG: hypothetical protein WBN10_14000 [Polyangiales bacterium]
MTDPRIPADRRMLHTLQALTGMRIGEACGRRWRDYDRGTPGLDAMHVWSQCDDQPLKTGRAVHEKQRFVPVHPALAKALAHWHLSGFAQLYGRPPSDDDFIVPDPSTMGARTRSKAGKDHRADVEALGIYQRGRLTHGLRRWFISACRNAFARRDPRSKRNDLGGLSVEAVGIEQPAAHSIPTILERFRGQVSPKTRSNNANKTRYRTFL